eukprot:scaffold2002_cov116-Skeletonema_dohrnii-CCMP3373.AAC.1
MDHLSSFRPWPRHSSVRSRSIALRCTACTRSSRLPYLFPLAGQLSAGDNSGAGRMEVMKSRSGLALAAAYDKKIARIEEENKIALDSIIPLLWSNVIERTYSLTKRS